MAPVLTLAGVERRYDQATNSFTLSIPSLVVEPGERIVLVGPSGAGKSTLLDMLAFLAAPDSAERFICRLGDTEYDVAALWSGRRRDRLSALRARYLGYVLQTGGLLPYLSVAENIYLARRLLGLDVPGPAEKFARAVQIHALFHRMPGQLSLGERQRVAVVRAVAHGPALVLADEPTAALDGNLALTVVDSLIGAAEDVGAALIMTTHDLRIAERVNGRIVSCRPLEHAASPISVVEG